jgi:hypothetical protein
MKHSMTQILRDRANELGIPIKELKVKKCKLSEMKTWEWNITLRGSGETSEEAWKDAVEHFQLDPGCEPEDPQIVEES